MRQSTFNLRFTSILLLMGAVMVNLGFLVRPVQLQDSFDLPAFIQAHENQTIWIWSFRFLVFGLFMEVMGLAALKSLFRQSEADTVISTGILVSTFALMVTALAEGYYMHMGAWAGWKVSTLEPSLQTPFLQTLEVTREWVVCLTRMGYMFFCMGLVGVGWGLIRTSFFPKWLGIYALTLGIIGIMVMLVFDSRTDLYVPVRWGISIFFFLTGWLLLTTKQPNDGKIQ